MSSWSDNRLASLSHRTENPASRRAHGAPGSAFGVHRPPDDLLLPRSAFQSWVQKKQADKVDEWSKVLQMGEFARQLSVNADRERYLQEQRMHQMQEEAVIERQHAFWWLDINRQLSSRGLSIPLIATFFIVGLMLFIGLIIDESSAESNTIFGRRLLPAMWVRPSTPPLAERNPLTWDLNRVPPPPPLDNLAGSYIRLKGGQLVPKTGEVAQMSDGRLEMVLPPAPHLRARGPALVALRHPTDMLICAWMADHRNHSALFISWWKLGSPRWTKPYILWKNEDPGDAGQRDWERPVFLVEDNGPPGSTKPPSLSIMFSSLHPPPAPPPPPFSPGYHPKHTKIFPPSSPGRPFAPRPPPPPPYPPEGRWNAPEAPRSPAVPGLPKPPGIPPPLPPPSWPPQQPDVPRPPALPISPDAPLVPLTTVMMMRSQRTSLENLIEGEGNDVSEEQVPLLWYPPVEMDNSAGLLLGAPLTGTSAALSARFGATSGFLLPASVHVSQGGHPQDPYSVLRFYDGTLNPKKEFVLSRPDEKLVRPVVIAVWAWEVAEVSPPPPAPWSPARVIGEGFQIRAPDAPPLPRPPPTQLLVALFSSVHPLDVKQRVHRSVSLDNGTSWTQPTATSLPNFRTPLAATQLASGALLCVFTNRASPTDLVWGNRLPNANVLSVAVSYDSGITWPWVRDVQEHFESNMVYSDPSIENVKGLRVFIAYTSSFFEHDMGVRRQSSIRMIAITEEWVRDTWPNGVSTLGQFKGDIEVRGSIKFGSK